MTKAGICAVMMTLVIGTAAAADTKAGHVHARRASTLAASGKCKQAIGEFTAAYRVLRDPALLFNRAECLRKTGLERQAVYDYRKFLEEMPKAPNRQTVESRIAALDPTAVKAAAPETAVQASAEVPVAEPAPAAPVATASPVVASPIVTASPVVVPASSPVPSALAESPSAPPLVAAAAPAPGLHTASLRVTAVALSSPPPAPERNDAPAVIIAQPAPAAPDHSERTAWIWMSVATAVVAAAAASAAIIASKPRHNP
jgi:tetratricopeptide (TPR) repeat protein